MSGEKLMAGFGRQRITPALGVELSGFGYYLQRRAQEVLDHLYVRALALSGGGQRVVLISCDLLGMDVSFCDALRQAIADELGLDSAGVLIACTHTHYAPACQPLEGLGRIDNEYLAVLGKAIRRSAAMAVDDLQKASLSFVRRTVEPIGYNRRTGCFDPIDPVLNVALLSRAGRSICLASYACHAVTRYIVPGVSADWPGALCRTLEREGLRAIVFQGFCGDINPISLKDEGNSRDPAPMGELLGGRAIAALRDVPPAVLAPLRAAQMRIRLPLDVLDAKRIDQHCRREKSTCPNTAKFMGWWRRRAMSRRHAFIESPWLTNVPVQAIRVGPLHIVGLPGEIFCRLGAAFQAQANAFTFGFCGGNIGYVPTADAYDDPADYAAWEAPRFYGAFPFRRDAQQALVDAGLTVLKQVQAYRK